MENKNNSICSMITQKVINFIEKDNLNWKKLWYESEIKNLVTKKHYKGINAILLGIDMHEKGFTSPNYVTFQRLKKLGGHLKYGSHGTQIIHYDTKKYQINACKICKLDREHCKCNVYANRLYIYPKCILKTYTVFNIEQTNLSVPVE